MRSSILSAFFRCSHRRAGWLSLALIVGLWAGTAEGFDASCRQLYKSQQYLKAAACFKQTLAAIDKNKSLGALAATLKNRNLRDAAVSYSRAADAASKPHEKAYYKELAVKTLDDALGRAYCKIPSQCSHMRKLRGRFHKEIQYSRLAVFTGMKDATLSIEGYHYKHEAKGEFNQQLRPGKYVVVLQAKGKKEKRQEVTLKPLTKASLNMQTAKIKIKRIIVAKKIPPLVLAGYIGGGVLLLGGVALAVVGYVNQSGLNTCRQDASCAQDAQAYDREFDQAGALIAIGYATAVGGILFLGGTAMAQVFANKNPANRPPPRLSRSTSLGHFGWPR